MLGLIHFAVFFFSFVVGPAYAHDYNDYALCVQSCPSMCAGGRTTSGRGFFQGSSLYTYVVGCEGYAGGCFDCGLTIPVSVGSQEGSIQSPRSPACSSGSIVDVDSQTLGEAIPIVGADWTLNYSSRWTKDLINDYKIYMPLAGNPVDPAVSYFDISTSILGNVVDSGSAANAVDYAYRYQWNGLVGGVPVLGSVKATVTALINGTGTPLTFTFPVGTLKATLLGFGGWLPSAFHFYDQVRGQVYRGDGSVLVASALPAGGGNFLVIEPDQSKVYEFNSAGKHLYTRTSLLGTVVQTFNYDGNGLLISIVEPFGRTTTFSRGVTGELQSITAPDGGVTSVTLDGNGLLATVTSPGSASYVMTYASGTELLATFTKPEGQVSTLTYDGDGLLVNDSHSGGYEFDLTKTGSSRSEYEQSHLTSLGRTRTSYISNTRSGLLGNYQRYDYLPSGALRTTSESYGTEYQTAKGVSQSTGLSSDIRWGDAAQLVSYRVVGSRNINVSQTMSPSNPDFPSPSTAPFSFSTLTTTKTVNSQDTVSVFDATTKTFTTTSPEGRVRETEIDSYERLVSDKWGADNAVTYTYTNDKLTSVDQSTRNTTLTYGTSSGLLTSVTNALSETTALTYDSSRRVTYVTYPDLRAVQFTYDDNGNVVGVTPPGRSIHGLSLNGHELLGTYQPPTLGGVGVVNTGYTYNNDKQLTQITRPDAQTIVYEYGSSTGVLEKITTPDGDYTFGFDTSAERTSMGATPASVTNYLGFSDGFLTSDTISDSSGSVGYYSATYDSLRHLQSDEVAPASGSAVSVNYSYDNDELLTTAGALAITRGTASGRVEATDLGNIVDTWSYNSYGELTGYAATYGTAPLFSYTITRDALGRVDTLSEVMYGTTSSFDYNYDNSGRLTTVTKGSAAYSSYTYDNNSNRTSGTTAGTAFTAVVDAQDRLTDYNLLDFTYTANGELSTKVNTLTSQTTTYVYDVLGNLKSVVVPSVGTITYEADAFNRRSIRKKNGTVTSKYIYADGLRIVGELSSTNTLKARFIYGTKSHVPDYVLKSGVKYRIITDHLGSVRMVVRDSNGTVAQRMDYDNLGRVLVDTSPGFQPFGFAGGLYDYETKLVRFGARDYDAEMGRWTNKDPIRFQGRDTNLYGYTFNDPINFLDPSGLAVPPEMTDPSRSRDDAAIDTSVADVCILAPSVCSPDPRSPGPIPTTRSPGPFDKIPRYMFPIEAIDPQIPIIHPSDYPKIPSGQPREHCN
ncbi:MAG: RHS repeat-associated core domain-containing protein [Bdellovibrionales bacterium]|nr:RHS repeat-associated core domain-containing protein [Bdellovibrionales bacterium]